jgi:hypothetical protein
MEKEIVKNTSLIAACGLYCGACGSYTKGRCPGCKENSKASWCKVRSCCMEKSIDNCSQCIDYPNPQDCTKYNFFISNLIGFVTGTKRSLNIEAIKQKGAEGFVTFMTENKWQSIPKKYKLRE